MCKMKAWWDLCPSLCPDVSYPELLNGFRWNLVLGSRRRTEVWFLSVEYTSSSSYMKLKLNCIHFKRLPASYPMGTMGSFPGGKAAGAWSWPLTPSNAEVKNEWSYTSTPQYAFMPWCSVKAQWQLYLYLYLKAHYKNAITWWFSRWSTFKSWSAGLWRNDPVDGGSKILRNVRMLPQH
jgi:hypothetical protein